MSPYRVLIRHNKQTYILCASLSTDKLTGQHRIFIISKYEVNDDDGFRKCAHSVNTKKSSMIITKYIVRKHETLRRYKIETVAGTFIQNGKLFYTLSECQKAAMEYFCNRNGYIVIKEL